MNTTVATPDDNNTDRTMVMFNLGVQAGLHQAAERTRLRKIAQRAARIETLPEPQRATAYARLAAATHQAGTR